MATSGVISTNTKIRLMLLGEMGNFRQPKHCRQQDYHAWSCGLTLGEKNSTIPIKIKWGKRRGKKGRRGPPPPTLQGPHLRLGHAGAESQRRRHQELYRGSLFRVAVRQRRLYRRSQELHSAHHSPGHHTRHRAGDHRRQGDHQPAQGICFLHPHADLYLRQRIGDHCH